MESVSNLPCREVFARLDDYLDRTLSPDELAAVERHLLWCATCAHEFRFDSRLVEELRHRLGRLRMPADLALRISARLPAEGD